MRSIQKVGDFDTVASGGFTTLTLDPTGHYFGVNILCMKDDAGGFQPMSKADIIADIALIQIELGIDGLGNEIIVQISPERLFEWLDWRYGTKSAYAQSGCIPIPFTRNRLPAPMTEENSLGIGTRNVNKIAVALTYKTNAGFVAKRLTLKRDVDEDININIATYPVLTEENREISTTGIKSLRNLPKQIAGAALLSIHVTEGATGVVSEIDSVKLGSKIIAQHIDSEEHDILAHFGERAVQADLWSIDFQRTRGWLSLANTKEFDVKMNYTTAPGAYDIVVDMLKGLAA